MALIALLAISSQLFAESADSFGTEDMNVPRKVDVEILASGDGFEVVEANGFYYTYYEDDDRVVTMTIDVDDNSIVSAYERRQDDNAGIYEISPIEKFRVPSVLDFQEVIPFLEEEDMFTHEYLRVND